MATVDLRSVAASGDGFDGLSAVEQALLEHVERGELLDLAGDQPVDEASMRSWDASRTVRAHVVRDIVRGRLVAKPDPHGLRLRGARIAGRVDLENITSTVSIELDCCLLDEGLNVGGAYLPVVTLHGCHLEHSNEPPLDAGGLTGAGLMVDQATITAHSKRGAMYVSGAHLRILDCTGARIHNDSGPALHADGLQVDLSMILRNGFDASGSGELGAVRLPGAHVGGQLDCTSARMRNDSGPALDAEQSQVDLNVFLRGGFEASGSGEFGAVRLLGAHVGGLECDGARLHNDSGSALHADGLQVDQSVFLRGGFEASGSGELGAVRLLNAHIDGILDCTSARMRNDSGPALDADGLQVTQNMYLGGGFEAIGGGEGVALRLAECQIGGVMQFQPARLVHGTSPQQWLRVDGLVYKGLPLGITARSWLRLLSEGTPEYDSQPYQQLAAAHRAAGHDSESRRVLMQQRRDQIRRKSLTGRAERTWARLTGLLLGYGYQPWRALIGLLAVLAVAVLLAVVLGGHGGLAAVRTPPLPATLGCTVVERIGVGLDVGTPLITTGARDSCRTTSTAVGQVLTVMGWALRLLAWAFATLFIAGFTGAVRKT